MSFMVLYLGNDESGTKGHIGNKTGGQWKVCPFFFCSIHHPVCILSSFMVFWWRKMPQPTYQCIFCFTESSTAAQTWWRYWRCQILSHSHISIFSEHLMKMCFCHLPLVRRPSACWSSHRQTCRRRLLRVGGWVPQFQFRLTAWFWLSQTTFCFWAERLHSEKKTNGTNGIVVLLLKGAATIKEFYARNSRWTEGLISAAKAVGWGATEMV